MSLLELNVTDLITRDGVVIGYIYDFGERGAFEPNGHIAGTPPTDRAAIDRHNNALAGIEFESAKQTGKAVWYYMTDAQGKTSIGDWASHYKFPVNYQTSSWHNMAGPNGRTDFYFTGPDCKQWHGVNIGDSQIVRCHRLKKQR